MNISYLCQSYPPMVSGAAVIAEQIAEAMVSRGHSILVFCASDKGKAYSKVTDNYQLIRLHAYHNPLRVDQHFSIWGRGRIRDELKRFQTHIMHLHDILSFGASALKAAKDLKIPVIATIHQLPHIISPYLDQSNLVQHSIKEGLWIYGNWILNQCERIIAPSEYVAQKLNAHINQSSSVISNGVDLNIFKPDPSIENERDALCKKYGLNPLLPIILHVGRLDKEKYVDIVIRASAAVMQQIKVQLLVVGDGCDREKLEILCKDLGIARRCHFPGFIGDNLSDLI